MVFDGYKEEIYEAKHPNNCIVKDTKMWHFEKMVYSKSKCEDDINSGENESRSRSHYNKILLDSRYSLCPSGSGLIYTFLGIFGGGFHSNIIGRYLESLNIICGENRF